MSELKFSPNLFLEEIELNRFKKFIDTDGFRKFLIEHTNSFGLIRKENATFNNSLVEEDTGLTIKVREIKAFNSAGKLIYAPAQSEIAVPADNNWYWVKIAYQTTTLETGTFSIDSSGNLVCTSADAELLTILRGQPNFPTRISFPNAVSNVLEYDVLEVVDNNNAVLQGDFTSETDLNIAVVGTFTPGYVPLTAEKFIFQYDSCLLSLVASNTATEPAHTSGTEFFIARVKNDGAAIKIEDKRNEIWTVDSNYFLHQLERIANPLIGVEQVTYDDALSPKDKSIIRVAWGFRSSSFSVNPKTRVITLTGGEGGIFKSSNFASLFANGDFDGWRLYVESGEYYKIASSTLNASTIELTMEQFDAAKFFSDVNSTVAIVQELLVVPDAEEIEIICVPDPSSGNLLVDKRVTVPIDMPYVNIPLSVYASTGTLYNVKYRYKHIRDYSPTLLIPDDTEGLYAEDQFTSKGVLIGSPTRTPYTADDTDGFIPLKLHPTAYSVFVDRIDLGDKLGVDTSVLSNATPVVELVVGEDRQYQYFSDGDDSASNDALTLTTDMFIVLMKENVDTDPCRNGNFFLLHFKQKIILNGFNLRIVTDYVNPADYTELKLFTAGDEKFLEDSEEGIFIRASFTDQDEWIVNNVNEHRVADYPEVFYNAGISVNTGATALPITGAPFDYDVQMYAQFTSNDSDGYGSNIFIYITKPGEANVRVVSTALDGRGKGPQHSNGSFILPKGCTLLYGVDPYSGGFNSSGITALITGSRLR